MALSYSEFLASRKNEAPATKEGVCDWTVPMFAELLASPEFNIHSKGAITTAAKYVQTRINAEHNQNSDTAKPAAAERHITAMYAMLVWLAKTDTNHVRVDGKEFRLTLVPTDAPAPVPLADKPRAGNPVAAK